MNLSGVNIVDATLFGDDVVESVEKELDMSGVNILDVTQDDADLLGM